MTDEAAPTVAVWRRRPGPAALLLVLPLLGAATCKRRALPPRGDAPAVVLVERDAGDGDWPALQAEKEPNDHTRAAQALTLGPEGVGISGNLPFDGKRFDSDGFWLDILADQAGEATGPAVVVVTAPPEGQAAPPPPDAATVATAPPRHRVALLSESTGDSPLRLEVADARGQVLVRTSSQAGTARIPNLAGNPGDRFLVRVTGVVLKGKPAADLAYRLQARLLPAVPGDEVEPNGTQAQATPVEPALTMEVAGLLGWRRDTDWYVLPPAALAGSSRLSAELELPPGGGTASLAMHDAFGRSWADAGAPGRGVIVLRDVRPPEGAGPLYLVVQAEAGEDPDNRYLLRVRGEQAAPDRESEPNQSPGQAQPLPSATPMRGTAPPGDSDLWALGAAARLALTPPEGVPLEIVLLSADGTPLGAPRMVSKHAEIEIGPGDDGVQPMFVQIRAKSSNRLKSMADYLVEAAP